MVKTEAQSCVSLTRSLNYPSMHHIFLIFFLSTPGWPYQSSHSSNPSSSLCVLTFSSWSYFLLFKRARPSEVVLHMLPFPQLSTCLQLNPCTYTAFSPVAIEELPYLAPLWGASTDALAPFPTRILRDIVPQCSPFPCDHFLSSLHHSHEHRNSTFYLHLFLRHLDLTTPSGKHSFQ